MNIDTDAILRLHDFLKEEESIPDTDAAGIIKPSGVDSKVRAQTIRDCIRIVEDGLDSTTKEA